MIEKLEQIDEILASYEDWMHGKDGENCTKARKLLIEVTEEVKNISSKPVLAAVVFPQILEKWDTAIVDLNRNGG